MANKSFFEWWLLNMPNILFFVLLLSSVYEAIYFLSQYKMAIQKAEQLKKQQAQQKLDALKTRVNPHFLFNSLTTLSALIGEDAPRAEQFVDELSKVYRYLLRAGRQPTATLGEELQFAESYAFLLKNRFEAGAFSLSISQAVIYKSPPDSKAALDQPIPALTFQNALEYLVRTQNAPLHIQVDMIGRTTCASPVTTAPKPCRSMCPTTIGNNWKRNGAKKREVQAGQLSMLIPFTSNSSSK